MSYIKPAAVTPQNLSDQIVLIGGETNPTGTTGNTLPISVGSTGVLNAQQANTSFLTDSVAVFPKTTANDVGATYATGTALTNTAVSLKTSAGNLLDGVLFNPNTANGATVKFFNAIGSTVVMGTTATWFKVALGSTFGTNRVALRDFFGDAPLYFSTAISMAATQGFADSDNTTLTGAGLISYFTRVV